MCDVDKIEQYGSEWDDYFAYVNTGIIQKLLFEDDLYIGYGAHNGLPVTDIKYWYKDAEAARIPVSLHHYITHKYEDHGLNEDDVDHLIDIEIDAEDLYESNGYWFRA